MPAPLYPIFTELTALLHQHAVFWRHYAFQQPALPWFDSHPRLRTRLLALTDQQIESLGNDNQALARFLAPELPFAEDLYRLTELPAIEHQPLPLMESRFCAGIPGRKWQQVEAFAACLPPSRLPILEWCAGKSHLGMLLHHSQNQTVSALEWDKHLVAQANARAQQRSSDLQAHRVDVMSAEVLSYLLPQQRIVALHACGDLHGRLLQLSAQYQVQELHLAPCCYQKIAAAHYEPFSVAAGRNALALTKQDLHTAVMETVTADQYAQRQRRQLQMYRLGFDCLQREVLGGAAYLALPSLPGAWARTDFRTFCQHCAAIKHVELPDQLDWAYYEVRGQQRFAEVAALDLVRFLFRRPLEIWLALDRALFLQEQGYQVSVATFCARKVTPRNILIQAGIG